MIFGGKQLFAVECEFTSQIKRWVNGRFRVWVGGDPIGTYSDEVLDLMGTTGTLRNPVRAASSVVLSLTAQVFLDTVWAAVYVSDDHSDGYNHEEFPTWSPYVWFESCEGFENVRSVIAMYGSNYRIVWHISGDPSVKEQYVPSSVYEAVTSAFNLWLDIGLNERRKGIDQ
jgi:hypothetical protein